MPRIIRFFRTHVAGYLYTQGFNLSIHCQLMMGDRLRLVREPCNFYDSNVITIYTKADIKQGHVPRNRYKYITLLLDRGIKLDCMDTCNLHAGTPCLLVHIGIKMGDQTN